MRKVGTIVAATCLGSVLCSACAHDQPRTQLHGLLAALVTHPVPLSSCTRDRPSFNEGGRGPYVRCRWGTDMSYVVDADSTVVAIVEDTTITAATRDSAFERRIRSVSRAMGNPGRCPRAVFWEKNDWHVRLSMRPGTDVSSEMERVPWNMMMNAGHGPAWEPFACKRPKKEDDETP